MTKKISEYTYERADVDGAIAFIDGLCRRAGAASSATELAALRDELNAYYARFSTAAALAMIRHSLDVRDGFYAAEQDYYDENLPRLSAAMTRFDRALIDSPYADGLSRIVNPIIVDNIRAGLRVMDERIIAECVEENKLVTEYDKLLASQTYEWNGKKVTLSEMHGFCKSPERAVRKRAFDVIGDTLMQIRDRLDDLFDRLVKVRTAMAKKMGFENFVEMGDLRIGHIGYGREQIRVFRESALADAVPVLCELKRELARKLGLSDGMHLYDNDIYTVGGNVDPVGDARDMFAAAQRMYDDMNADLGAFFKRMCDAEAIDYASRDGKMGGGYAEMLFAYGQPFIFANFNGTMDDVGVLTHELGHAYAFYRAAKNNIDLSLFVGGMETAETHSMSMEALCNRYNAEFYAGRAEEATYQQIFDALNFLPYGVTVDYFQQLVYEKPDMTPAERRALWAELEARFRPYLDMSDMPYYREGGRWQYQKHIFESPFYYIDYCLSTCLALQFGEIADSDYADALGRYLDLVEAGGTKSIDELAHGAGLTSPFDAGALKSLCAKVRAHLKRLAKD